MKLLYITLALIGNLPMLSLIVRAQTLVKSESYDYVQNHQCSPYDPRKEPVYKKSDDTPVTVPGTLAGEHREDYEKRMNWWYRARFGMFIHWGPCVIGDDEISWSREPLGKRYSPEVYDEFYHRFNPMNFDPDRIVSLAKAAGMKYIVFTTKHHDGFCNWDTKATDYNIMHSPYGRDIVKELSEACNKQGVVFGEYYSQPDIHNPDNQGFPPNKDFKKNENGYSAYVKQQLHELLTNYGHIGLLWFDCGWERSPGWNSWDEFQEIHRLQPGIIIDNRAGLPGDFYTPEQSIGAFDRDRHWESCMTIYKNGYWSWRSSRNGQDELKPPSQCIQFLVRCAIGDGNMLLDFAPGRDGSLPQAQVDLLKAITRWMNQNGKSIQDTIGGPYKPVKGMGSTCHGNIVYLHILRWTKPDILLSPLPVKVLSAKRLNGAPVDFAQDNDGIKITVPSSVTNDIDTIIQLSFDGNVDKIAPVNIVPGVNFALHAKATASDVYGNDMSWGPDKAVDGDELTRWATDDNQTTAWLQVDLGAIKTFSHCNIIESDLPRVQSLEIQYKKNEEWITICKGDTIGASFEKDFPPVQAQYVRLNILRSLGGPTINEFQIIGL